MDKIPPKSPVLFKKWQEAGYISEQDYISSLTEICKYCGNRKLIEKECKGCGSV